MSVSIWQATLFGIFACLAFLPGMGGTVVGNYTLGRPLVGGLICGLIMGDVATGIIAGAAIQIVYIALITPGGAVAADVVFRIFHIKHPVAKGIALGTSAHAIGTTKALSLGKVEGAMSSLAIGVSGIITVMIAPYVWNIVMSIL